MRTIVDRRGRHTWISYLRVSTREQASKTARREHPGLGARATALRLKRLELEPRAMRSEVHYGDAA